MLRKYGMDTIGGASARDYYRLLDYIRTEKERSTANLMHVSTDDPPSGSAYSPPSLDEVITRFPPPDLEIQIQCSDGAQYDAYMVFLSAHFPTLRDRIRALVGGSPSTSSVSATSASVAHSDRDSEPSLPVLETNVDSATLSTLLAFSYTGYTSTLQLPSNLRLLSSTLIAAQRLDMPHVADAAKEHWERAALAEPLQAYFVAIAHGQESLTRFAERRALDGCVAGVYARGMDSGACPALAYHRLLEYHEACAQAARDVVLPR